MVPVSTKNHWLLLQEMCINSVAFSMVSSIHFSLIFSQAIATSYKSNLSLFLVVNEIKCKYGNNSRLKSQGEVFLGIILP